MKTVYVNNETQREGSYTYHYELSSEDMNHQNITPPSFAMASLEEEIATLPKLF
ncbi:MAG: hypothetical protein IPN22_14620 [Bacteroidetes bacterium]|nr:hypothetical protein [Bacteroidota bacterium]